MTESAGLVQQRLIFTGTQALRELPPTCFMCLFVRQQAYTHTHTSLGTNQVSSYFCVSVVRFTQGVKVCAVGTPDTVCNSGDDGAEAHVLLIIVNHLIKDEIKKM